MTDRKSSKLKTESFKNDEFFNRQGFELEFGKPVRLPYIRNNNATLDRRSIEKELTQKIFKSTKKKKKTVNASQLDLLTAQELQLCENKQQLNCQNNKKGFPKLSYNSRENTQRLIRIKSQKNIAKLEPYQNLKDYKIGSIVGRGSYAIVRLARNYIGKKFAIKTYSKLKIDSIDKQTNLDRQIRILKEMDHPNILSFVEQIQTEDSIHIVTELFDNTSLYDLLKKQEKKKICEKDAVKIMAQIFDAFAYMHEKGIIHRDVKLENILISKNLNIKIIDFGFSTKDQGLLYDFCGTPHYIAPEVIHKKGYFGKPADVWSLGILFYRIVTGNFPFKGMNQKNIYSKISRGQFKMPEIGEQIQSVIKQMLQQNPQQRITVKQILTKQPTFYYFQK